MKKLKSFTGILLGLGLLAGNVPAQDAAAPYKVLDTTRLMGNGGTDYVYADNDERRVYVPCAAMRRLSLTWTATNISAHHQHQRPRRGR